jgi:hypothetical protein
LLGRGIRGRLGCILYRKWLKLSREVDECKPLPSGRAISAGVAAQLSTTMV